MSTSESQGMPQDAADQVDAAANFTHVDVTEDFPPHTVILTGGKAKKLPNGDLEVGDFKHLPVVGKDYHIKGNGGLNVKAKCLTSAKLSKFK